MREKKVGIVTINYNNYHDTKEFIESIKKIEYKNYILIVVDNCSTDDSISKLIREFSDDVIFIKNKRNLGFAAGNNVGIKYALENNCDYILIINNDTVVDKYFLKHLVNKITSEDSVGAVGGKIYYYSNKEMIWSIGGTINKFTASARYYGVNELDRGQYDNIHEIDMVSGCMMLLNSKMLTDIGLLSEKFFFRGEEWEFSHRIKKNKYKILFEPKAIIYHKVSRSHKRFSYYDIYSAYRAKLIFARTYMNYFTWYIWLIFFSTYSLTFSYLYFKKNSKSSINYYKYTSLIMKVITHGIKRDYVTLEDIQKIKLSYDI